MTIDYEGTLEKKKVEDQIFKILADFEERTGITIKGMYINRGDLTSPGKGKLAGFKLNCGIEYEGYVG